MLLASDAFGREANILTDEYNANVALPHENFQARAINQTDLNYSIGRTMYYHLLYETYYMMYKCWNAKRRAATKNYSNKMFERCSLCNRIAKYIYKLFRNPFTFSTSHFLSVLIYHAHTYFLSLIRIKHFQIYASATKFQANKPK